MPAASGQRDTRTRLADSAAADSAKGWAAAHARCLLESLGRCLVEHHLVAIRHLLSIQDILTLAAFCLERRL